MWHSSVPQRFSFTLCHTELFAMCGRYLQLLLSSALLAQLTNAAQILGLFAHPGKSHFDFFRPMLLELAGRGHNVSVYSYFPLKHPVENYTDYVLEGMPLLTDFVDLQAIETDAELLGQAYKVPTFFMLHDWGLRSCQVALNSPLISQLLSSAQRFDVILLEHFSNDCMAAVAHLLQAPMIALSSCAIMPWHYKRMGTPFINTIMPMNFLPYNDEMHFAARLNNFLHFHVINALYNFITQPATDALISQRFGSGLPPINEIVKNTSLMLINQYYALTGPRPYTSNVVEVGGLQVGASQPLPEHLARLFEAATLGVIYISWGSMVNPSSLPQPQLQALYATIAQFPDYTFVLRWNKPAALQNKPKNLYTYEWLPQRDLLCHPRVKAFITHGGLLGSTEAVHCAVPMLVTPFYGDQFLNAAAIVQRRFGLIVGFKNFNEPQLTEALTAILQPSFAAAMKQSTIAFRSRPQPPLDLAVWWIEHVIATRGAVLSQSVARHINWFVYNSIDVYVCCLGFVFLSLLSVWKIIKYIKCNWKQHKNKAKQQ
ncbi:UDP-glucuronosyltransferase 1-3 [Drosophila busckii]|uniref:UDP-glucuronosyltransferase 1-3 n=1 Tax=Drosophila busckii TaxID=30019 RepID=UPI001433258D|nr:UDP-glucuronosyltransferase 1-3 [Drosophila busckii]